MENTNSIICILAITDSQNLKTTKKTSQTGPISKMQRLHKTNLAQLQHRGICECEIKARPRHKHIQQTTTLHFFLLGKHT